MENGLKERRIPEARMRRKNNETCTRNFSKSLITLTFARDHRCTATCD